MLPAWPCLVASVLLGGCAFSVDEFAGRHGFESSIVDGTGYRHLVLSRDSQQPAGRLHIYIEGDGVPWIRGLEPADDPTPRNPLALRLMASDSADAAYVGRPCYFGLAADDGCEAASWTSDRYSGAVVSSMAQVVRTLAAESRHDEVVLIGFSGGGVIARLIAWQIPNLRGLLTVNANLDVEEWAAKRGFLPLTGSMNPADEAGLPPHILHVQALGSRDRVVPRAVTDSYRRRHDDLIVWQYPEFDHACCWLAHWPAILRRFDEQLETRQRAIVRPSEPAPSRSGNAI